MVCTRLNDRHMCALALIKSGERLPVFDPTAAVLLRQMAPMKLVSFDQSDIPMHPSTREMGYGYAVILRDGLSVLADYRELGADV
jgi:hypothetical protein